MMKPYEPVVLFATTITGRLQDLSHENVIMAKFEAERKIQHAMDEFHQLTGFVVDSVDISHLRMIGPSGEEHSTTVKINVVL